MNKNRIAVYSILLIYLAIVVLHHLFGYTGHFGFDDLHYAELADGLLKGNVDFEDHYSYRFPVVLLTSLFYLLFGINDFSSALPAMAITIVILIIVFNILREHGPKTIILGLSLTVFSNWFLFYSDKLMPDIYVALSVIWALAVLNRYRYKSGQRKTAGHAFLFAFALLLGFMSKGTIVLMLPLLLYLLVTDIIQKRNLKFWGYSLISGF
ncbi:MAG: glycosyltransferase family 39 protein, partial [Bacteroidota bacterium]|nr:glycosyltransferase family 39 protein [Bacteroidota bacterium]